MIQHAAIISTDTNAELYHSTEHRRGEVEFPVHSSMLREVMTCARRWRDGYVNPDSKAKKWGSLLDCHVLTPGNFKQRYAVVPTHYTRDGEQKNWRNDSRIPEVAAWQTLNAKKEHISNAEYEEVADACRRLALDPVIRDFLDCSQKQVYVSAEWHDQPTGLVVPVRVLLDCVPSEESEFLNSLGDLKTTRSGARHQWKKFCHQRGYHLQAGLYLDMWNTATGQMRDTWCFILQENFAPWVTAKRFFSQRFLNLGRREYRAALAFYCQCLKNNQWPDYDQHADAVQGWSEIDCDDWMEQTALQDYLDNTTEAEPEPTTA